MAKTVSLADFRASCSLDALQSVRLGWSKTRQHFILKIESRADLVESWLKHVVCILHHDDEHANVRCHVVSVDVDGTSAIVEIAPHQKENLPADLSKDDPFFPFSSVTLDHFQTTRTFPNATSKAAFEKRPTTKPDDDFPFSN